MQEICHLVCQLKETSNTAAAALQDLYEDCPIPRRRGTRMASFRTGEVKEHLEAKREELTAALRTREGITIAPTPGDTEDVSVALELEMRTGDLERKSIQLHLVAAALRRLSDGTYGRCLRCGADIASARLVCVPWAPYCLPCQKAEEGTSLHVSLSARIGEKAPRSSRKE